MSAKLETLARLNRNTLVIDEGDEQFVLKCPPYQFGFMNTKARFPALVASIGTGKTRMALTKINNYCLENPGSLWIVIRKEYVDLRDSTMPDFESYFGVKINSNRNYDYPNGSRIMFRHGEEVQGGTHTPNQLKNLNLSGFMIEQAEEFLSDRTFTFLRDRLRRQNMPYHQGIIIANVAGHNWIYKIWKLNSYKDSVGKKAAMRARFALWEATTFDNEQNLPKEFIEDLKTMELESPAHYRRYVLNDWDEEEGVDILISRKLVESTFNIPGLATGGKALIIDPARSEAEEADDTAFSIFQRIDEDTYAQTMIERHHGWNTMKTVGRAVQILTEGEGFNYVIIGSNGLGGGVYDRIHELQAYGDSSIPDIKGILSEISLIGYNEGEKATDDKKYGNQKTEDAWELKKMLEKKQIRLLEDEEQTNEFPALIADYKSNGQRILVSKKKLKAIGVKSPNCVDTCLFVRRYLGGLSEARETTSPAKRNARDFWKMVEQDKERSKNVDREAEGEGWHSA